MRTAVRNHYMGIRTSWWNLPKRIAILKLSKSKSRRIWNSCSQNNAGNKILTETCKSKIFKIYKVMFENKFFGHGTDVIIVFLKFPVLQHFALKEAYLWGSCLHISWLAEIINIFSNNTEKYIEGLENSIIMQMMILKFTIGNIMWIF